MCGKTRLPLRISKDLSVGLVPLRAAKTRCGLEVAAETTLAISGLVENLSNGMTAGTRGFTSDFSAQSSSAP